MSTTGETRRVVIQGTVPPPLVPGLADFVEKHYLTPNLHLFVGSSYQRSAAKDGAIEFSWDLAGPRKEAPSALSVRLWVSAKEMAIEFTGDQASPLFAEASKRMSDDIEVLVTKFLARTKRASLYFVFPSGAQGRKEAPPPQAQSAAREVLRRIFAGNSVNLYLVLILVSLLLFSFFGDYTIFVMIGIQAIALFFSDRIVQGLGSVRPTKAEPDVTVVSVHSTPELVASLARRGGKVMTKVRSDLWAAMSPWGFDGPSAQSAIQGVMRQEGIDASLDDISVRTRDVYAIVEDAAAKFGSLSNALR